MSRVDKQLRRKRRKEKKHGHGRVSRIFGCEEFDLPPVVRLTSYQITPDPLNRAEEKIPGLDKALDPFREKLFDDVYHDPRAAIPILQRLLEQFPNAPMLLNWLSAAMGRAGDFEGANRVARQNFQANPDYLFARMNYAQMLLEDGDLKAVEEILDNKFDLKLLYPDRDVFHLSEFRAFSYLMIMYWIRKGEFEPARLLFDALEQLEPDGEVTRILRRAIKGSYLLDAVRKLSQIALRVGRLPREVKDYMPSDPNGA